MTTANADCDGGDDRVEYDVAIIGGGPAGCSVGVFTARYGLRTAIFDRGRSSLRQCAHLENYLGFPGGIGAETLYGLMHDHAETAGCEIVSDLVESVSHGDDGGGFVVETQDGRRVAADRVIAATRYGGEYLRPLGGDEMFETLAYGDEEHEQFDRSYAGIDGTTPVEGLYVASPSIEADHQAILAAGRGARVARRVIEDVRREGGYRGDLVEHYDWVRREAVLDDGWSDRETWREWFDEQLPDEHDLDEERWTELREREIDRFLRTYISEEESKRRDRRGQRRLLDHIDDDLILERAAKLSAARTAADRDD
jgi:hypothetical protein